MSHITPFCLSCGAYFPSGDACPACRSIRAKLATPSEPGRPIWTATLPGAPALRPALAHVDGRTLLLLPWGNQDAGTGGVVALDAADGSRAWDTPLDMPVEGGVAVAGSAGVAVVGLARRGPFSSEGALTALDLRTGRECWPGRVQTAAAVEAAPVTDDTRAYVAADDGQLYCVELLSGRLVWKKPVADKPVRIPAPPALLIERGIAQTIVVATYGVTQWQDDGKLVAFDAAGRRLWTAEAGGQARGAPVIIKGRVYVTAGRGNPATGVLSAIDLRTGRALWPAPFTIPAAAGGRSDIVAAPLVAGDQVYVGSHDHWLYAVDAATGRGRRLHEAARGIVATSAWAEGLAIFGANDGVVYAADAVTGERAWAYKLGGHVQAGLIAWDDVVFAASDNGAVAALPWHRGCYDWAAARLEAQGRRAEAGDCWALAGHFSVTLSDQELGYRQAASDWDQVGEHEKAAKMWQGLGGRYRRAAADAYRKAGLTGCGRDSRQAAVNFKRAIDLYYEIYATEKLNAGSDELTTALNECTLALAECIGLPHVSTRLDNANGLVQWEKSKLTLRLTNSGVAPIKGEVRIAIGGGFAELVEARLLGDLRARGQWRVPVTAIAVQPSSLLEIEAEYDTDHPDYTPLRTILLQPTTAAERPRPPVYNYNFGDVGVLKLAAGRADDGSVVQVVTGDIGLFAARGAQIGNLDVQGDVGALVGVDPATQRQVADLRASVGWLAGRLVQIESRPAGPLPATEADVSALREDLAGQRAFLATLQARLSDEQQAALEGITAGLAQLGHKLDAVAGEQQARRRAQPPTAPPAQVVDPRTARWSRGPDEFAARIEMSDLPGFLARGLVIEPGVCAIFLEDGRAEVGQVGPGHYALDTLLDRAPGMRGIRRVTAIVAEAGEVSLPFVLADLPAADGRRVTAHAELCFRLENGVAFLVNFMQGRARVSRDDLRDHLLPEVRDAAGEWIAPRPAAELGGGLVQKDALAAAVAEHLRGTLSKLGLRFERVRALAFG